jgi:aerobic carbon-monoxide dehydrogenase large subunit
MRLAGIVIGKAADGIVRKGKAIAAGMLEAPQRDIVYRDGGFVIAGTDRAIGLFELGPLSCEVDETVLVGGFPYGCHVCEVEVDPETGAVTLERYAAVDDVGRAINPLILHGQAHGGVAQGVGQALLEQCFYDAASGQPLSGTLMDYALARASDLPWIDSEISEVPSPTHPLGIRAGGEGGTTPALAVVVNAIVDALAHFGVHHVEMPATPERVWRAILEGRGSR